MSDHVPFELQAEIIERLPVKSLIQFRSVSKAWKSLIDSAEFIASHSTRHAHSHHLLIRYEVEDYDHLSEIYKDYVSFVDDETFPQQKFEPTIPLSFDLLHHSRIIGSSHGLFCLYGGPDEYDSINGTTIRDIAVIWNPTIRKSVSVELGGAYRTVLGFGVCPGTSDVKLVKITCSDSYLQTKWLNCNPWRVEVFTLSSGTWRRSFSNIPRRSIDFMWSQAVIDGFIYWFSYDMIAKDIGFKTFNLIMSFDMRTEDFIEINLPDSLATKFLTALSISKLRESLAVLDYSMSFEKQVCSVWEMTHGVPKSFTKLFTIEAPVASIQEVMGFRKSGQPVMVLENDDCEDLCDVGALVVYEPCSASISDLVIYGQKPSFLVNCYMETLLLLNVPES